MTLNGVLAALVAVTAACGFVAPWAAIVIGIVAGAVAVAATMGVERLGIDDPVGAVGVHGVAGIWGTLATGLFAVPALADTLATGSGGLVYTGSFSQLGVQALGLVTVGAFTFTASFGALWLLRRSFGIRVHENAEHAGLDVSEHGMWGYPEMFAAVSGGYHPTPSHLPAHMQANGHANGNGNGNAVREAREPELAG
jgi:Amt family ammonium transporter